MTSLCTSMFKLPRSACCQGAKSSRKDNLEPFAATWSTKKQIFHLNWFIDNKSIKLRDNVIVLMISSCSWESKSLFTASSRKKITDESLLSRTSRPFRRTSGSTALGTSWWSTCRRTWRGRSTLTRRYSWTPLRPRLRTRKRRSAQEHWWKRLEQK